MGQAKARGTLEQRQAQAKGLLELATARTGREIDMDLVQVLDQVAFAKLTNAMTEALTIITAKNKEYDPLELPLIADAQDDGRLFIRINVNDSSPRIIEVPAGGWRELTNEQINDIERRLDAEHRDNPEVLAELIGDMGKQIVASKEEYLRQKSISEALADKATEILIIFDRSPVSLEMAKSMSVIKQNIADSFDLWLSTDNDFIVIHWPKGKSIASMMAHDMDHLLQHTLPMVSADLSESVGTCVLRCNESHEFDAIRNRWKNLGGLVPEY
jgi:hypothetical protein